MSDENKSLVRRVLRAMETGDEAEIDAVIAEDYIQHNHLANGREPVKKMLKQVRQGLPDLRVEVEDMVAEGDRVMVRIKMIGTHSGRFMGVEPTGKPITIDAVDTWRIEAGRLKEHWDVVDRLGVMRQLGLV